VTSSLAKKKETPKPKVPKTGIFEEATHTTNGTIFKMTYDRGDLPIRVNFDGAVRTLVWNLNFENIDYKHYMPIFLEGLRETTEPYKFLAE
jgi:Parkin co-regulated protein